MLVNLSAIVINVHIFVAKIRKNLGICTQYVEFQVDEARNFH